MEIKLEARLLNEVIDALKSIADVASIDFSYSGAKSLIVDSAHVAIIELDLPKDVFKEYKAGVDDRLTFDTGDLKSKLLLNLVQPEQIISIHTSIHKDDVRYEFSSGNLKYITKPAEKYGDHKPKKPNLISGQKAFALVPTEELRQGCRAVESMSGYLTLEIDKEYFKMSGLGVGDSVELKLPLSDLEHQCTEPVKSLFPLDYFSLMAKAIPSEKTTVRLGKDWPVELNFCLNKPNAKGTYLLSHRIDS
jgi:proliferating cell nuclear antigen